MSPPNPALKAIQTATSSASIWSKTREVDFRKHLVALEERTNAVPVAVLASSYDENNHVNTDPRYLPLIVEKQVADDFAYLAAVTEGAQSVAAVCLEQHLRHDTNTLIVRFAGMDVVDENVRNMLSDIVQALQIVSQGRCTETTGKEADPREKVLELIIQQHKQKLLGRLRSKKWTKPTYLARTHKNSLWQDFDNLLHRLQHVYPKKSMWKIRSEIQRQLEALGKLYQDFESTVDNEIYHQLNVLVKATYNFCTAAQIQAFAAQVERAGNTPQIAAASKTFRQLEKIGAYWRISNTLVTATSRHPQFFKNIKLDYLTPYASIPTSIAYEPWAKTCHVHAEVQLVVHYALRKPAFDTEVDQTISQPRTIGTSKYLCYLCYLFLKYHGGFQILNTHGRLYDQWTVPDVEEYDETTREVFASILKSIDEHINRQVEGTAKLIWRPEPMTSRQNLLCLCEEEEELQDISSGMQNLRTE